MARSNSHCQRPKPVTSSNSISCTGTKQKLVRWLRPQTPATLVPLPFQDGPTDGKARFPGHVRPTIAVSTTHSRIWPCLPSQSLQAEYYASHGLVTLTFLYCSYKAKTVLKSSPPNAAVLGVLFWGLWMARAAQWPWWVITRYRIQLLCTANISFPATRPLFWQTNDIRAKQKVVQGTSQHKGTPPVSQHMVLGRWKGWVKEAM